jgi:hypothetical protein
VYLSREYFLWRELLVRDAILFPGIGPCITP